MNKLDDAIRQTLSKEEAALLESIGADQPLSHQLLQTLQGKLAWMNAVAWFAGFAVAGALAFCGWQFFHAPDIREMLIWGAGGGLACAGVVLIKTWFWLEMQKNSVVREVKRLELQIALLVKQQPR